MRYIKRFWKVASDRCKTYTIGALVLLIIFVGIDIYEFTLKNKAETEIENTANSVFDSLVQEIESMDMQTQEIMEPFKDMVIEIKPQWIKIALLAASSIIGVFIGIIKKPVEGIKGILSEGLEDETDEPEMWIPFAVLVVIDITEILLTFS